MSELKSKTHFRLESLDAHYFNSSSKTQSNQNYECLASKRLNLCFQYLRLQNKTTLKIKNKKKLRELSDITVTLTSNIAFFLGVAICRLSTVSTYFPKSKLSDWFRLKLTCCPAIIQNSIKMQNFTL